MMPPAPRGSPEQVPSDSELVIATSGPACSVALFGGGALIAASHEIVGRGHAERLLPMIAALPGGGRAAAIRVDCGPGSFTGVRVGLAAARGLALGWGVPVFGFSSLALIAAAVAEAPSTFTVAIPGGHGELFVQRFAKDPLRAAGDLASLPPHEAAATMPDTLIVGAAADALVAARGTGDAREGLADARLFPRLPASLTTLPPVPIYGRAPDARPAVA